MTQSTDIPATSDLDALLVAVSAEHEAGRDLDGTLALSAFEMAVSEPEEAPIAGVEREDGRDWRAIDTEARKLLAESKDLRVAVQLARARLQTRGLHAFCTSIVFVCALAERYWARAYPALEDDDATARVNALQELASAPVIAALRGTRLSTAPGIGPITVKEAVSTLTAGVDKADKALVAQTHAALANLGVEGLRAYLASVQQARAALVHLASFVQEKTAQAPRFDRLVGAHGERPGMLDQLERLIVASHARLSSPATEAVTIDESEATGATPAARSEASAPKRAGAGEIGSRDDVIAALDLVCAYYERAEPSSPVPLLLRRAQRLVSMDFFAIIKDLARQGVPEVALVAGLAADEPEPQRAYEQHAYDQRD